jgi:hypothetical protein
MTVLSTVDYDEMDQLARYLARHGFVMLATRDGEAHRLASRTGDATVIIAAPVVRPGMAVKINHDGEYVPLEVPVMCVGADAGVVAAMIADALDAGDVLAEDNAEFNEGVWAMHDEGAE